MTYEEIKARVLQEVPTVCPICGGQLNLSDDLMHLTCTNPECDGKVTRKIEIAAKALGIDNIGPGVANEVYGHLGVRSVYQLFDLTEADFMRVPRYQDGMATRLYSSIHAVNTVPFDRFIRACQFYRIGDGTAGDIAQAYASLDEFLGSNASDLANRLGSMSEAVASQIWESVEHNKPAVLELAKRVSIEYPEKQVAGTNASGRNLTCVVTGPLGFGPRPEFQSTFGVSYGIKWGSSVSKNTDILVTNETTPTGKFKKAKELQAAGNPIQIMTEEEFLAYIGANGSTAEVRVETTQAEVAGLSNYDGSVVDL